MGAQCGRLHCTVRQTGLLGFGLALTAALMGINGRVSEQARLLFLGLRLGLRRRWPRRLMWCRGNLAPFVFHAIQNVLGDSRGLHTILSRSNAKGDEN